MRFTGRGHPAIRATHDKTLEIALDDDITARATCVVAVGGDADPAAPMAGPVRIRITVGDERFSLDAVANPCWEPGGTAVIRRSSLRLPGTFATGASASAADLPRDLVTALQDPGALVAVDVVAVPDPTPTVVLFAADATTAGPDARLAAELARADRVEPRDAGARRLAPARRGDGPRRLVVATAGLPVNPDPGADRIETVGLPAPLAAAAAAGPGTVTLADPGADVREALRHTPASSRLVLTVAADRLDDLLTQAVRIRDRADGVAVQEFAPPVRFADGVAPVLASSADVSVCLAASPPAEALDPAVRAAVSELVSAGVPTRAVAKALAALTGWDRRRAYDAVLAWPS